MIEMHQMARTAILKIIEEEGGWVYTDHPIDRDKGTYAGIRYIIFYNYMIKTANNILDVPVTVQQFKTAANNNLLKDLVMDIYLEEYYNKLCIDDLIDVLKMPVFSCGVNCGVRRAGIILQRTINAVELTNLIEDGIIGSNTINGLNQAVTTRLNFTHNIASELTADIKQQSLYSVERLRNNFVKRWIRRYINITVDHPEYIVFLNGWFNRADKYWVS